MCTRVSHLYVRIFSVAKYEHAFAFLSQLQSHNGVAAKTGAQAEDINYIILNYSLHDITL